MTWVRRTETPTDTCHCQLPRWGEFTPEGNLGDLWRCDDCGKLWRVGRRCDDCDAYGPRHGGQCMVGEKWRPATRWQRFRHRRRPDSRRGEVGQAAPGGTANPSRSGE